MPPVCALFLLPVIDRQTKLGSFETEITLYHVSASEVAATYNYSMLL